MPSRNYGHVHLLPPSVDRELIVNFLKKIIEYTQSTLEKYSLKKRRDFEEKEKKKLRKKKKREHFRNLPLPLTSLPSKDNSVITMELFSVPFSAALASRGR